MHILVKRAGFVCIQVCLTRVGSSLDLEVDVTTFLIFLLDLLWLSIHI